MTYDEEERNEIFNIMQNTGLYTVNLLKLNRSYTALPNNTQSSTIIKLLCKNSNPIPLLVSSPIIGRFIGARKSSYHKTNKIGIKQTFKYKGQSLRANNE